MFDHDPAQAEISDIVAVGHLTTSDLFRAQMRNSDINLVGPTHPTEVAVLLFQGVIDDEEGDDS